MLKVGDKNLYYSTVTSLNNIEEKPALVFSLSDLNKKYSMHIKNGIIKIVDNVQGSEASFQTNQNDECFYRNGSTHIDNGIFYFILDSYRYPKAKYVYSFDQNNNLIECQFGALKDPHFVRNRLIEFGSGCNEDGYSHRSNGSAVITIYDLDKPKGEKQVLKYFLENGSGTWDCCIKDDKIFVSDQYDRRHELPIFKPNLRP